MSKTEYFIRQCDTSLHTTSPKRKLRNTDVTDYFSGNNETPE